MVMNLSTPSLQDQMQNLNIVENNEDDIDNTTIEEPSFITGEEESGVLLGQAGTDTIKMDVPELSVDEEDDEGKGDEGFVSTVLGETGQAVGQVGIGFTKGAKTAIEFMTEQSESNLGLLYNVQEWAADHLGNIGTSIYNFFNEAVNDDFIADPLSVVQTLSERVNVHGAANEIINNTSYKKAMRDLEAVWLRDFQAWLEVEGRDKGWVDALAYNTGTWIGELSVMPTGVGALKKGMAFTRPKSSIVSEAFKVAQKEGGMKEVLKKYDSDTASVVKKMLMNQPSELTGSWRELSYTLSRGAGYHTGASVYYGWGGGIAQTAGYYGMKSFGDFTDEEAKGYSLGFGLIGMMIGSRPFTSVPKIFIKKTIGMIPAGFKVHGRKQNLADVTRMGLKVRHLLYAEYYKNQGNSAKFNEHLLRYSGADKKTAKELVYDNEGKDTGFYLNKMVDHQVLDDAVSFFRMMQVMAREHPEYYDYVVKGQARVTKNQERFNKAFKDDPVMLQRMRDNFEKDLRLKNKHTEVHSEEELKAIIDDFDIENLTMMLDQVFMLDFMSAIRNKAVSEATLKTLSTKEAIDLFTEGYDYNQAMIGQLNIIESAVKAMKSEVGETTDTAKFLNEVGKTYTRVKKDIDESDSVIRNLIEDAEISAEGLSDRNYIETMQEMTGFRRFLGKTDVSRVQSEKEMVENVRTRFHQNREQKLNHYVGEYAKYDNVEIDATHVLDSLEDTLQKDKVVHALGSIGKGTAQRTLERTLPQFKARIRLTGIRNKFQLDELEEIPEGMSENDYIEVIVESAQELSEHTVGLHTSIKNIDMGHFDINNMRTYSNDSSPIQDVFKAHKENPLKGPELATELIAAMRREADEISKIPSESADIDALLNTFAEPIMTVGDARQIAKALFERASKLSPSRESSQRRDLFALGNDIMNGIDKGSPEDYASGKIIEGIRDVSSNYKKDIAEVYYQGWGKDFLNFRHRIKESDPASLPDVYAGILLKGDPDLAATQFNDAFPIGSEGREEAVEALMYSMGRLLTRGYSLNDLGKNFDDFAESFGDIIGTDNITKLKQYHTYIGGKYKIAPPEIVDDIKTVKRTIAAMNEDTLRELGLSSIALYAKSPEIDPEKLVNMILRNTAGRRAARKQTPADIVEEGQVRDTVKDVAEVTETGADVDIDATLKKSQLPVLRGGEEVTGDTMSILIEANPELRKPLQNIYIQYLLDQAIVPTQTKKLDRLSGSLDLQKELKIDEFSSVFSKNREVLSKLFDEKQMRNMQILFETGVASAGKNMALRVLNIAAEPTTSSRASRLFALQRKVVGMPYLATEQMVMKYQREKAAFLKRIIFDPEFAEMLKVMSTSKLPGEKHFGKFIASIRATYGEDSVRRQDIHLIREDLARGWQAFEDFKNFKIDIGQLERLYGSKLNQEQLRQIVSGLREMKTKYTLPERSKDMFEDVFIGLPAGTPFLSPRSMVAGKMWTKALQHLPESGKKRLAEAEKKSLGETAKKIREYEERQILQGLIGKNKPNF